MTAGLTAFNDGSSPRTWGWTDSTVMLHLVMALFPTHVGVDRRITRCGSLRSSLPHARGGGPSPYRSIYLTHASSPRTWGWTIKLINLLLVSCLFPTHVGVDRQ